MRLQRTFFKPIKTNTMKKIEQGSQEISVRTINNPEVFTAMSEMVKKHIKDNNLTCEIQGHDYPLVEAWQFAGGLLGIIPILKDCYRIETAGTVPVKRYGKETPEPIIKYMARCELIDLSTNNIVGNAFAICSNEEGKKRSFDEYAIASMAQTRAIGKAYRSVIGWLLGSMGLKTTPYEEMEGVIEDTSAKLVLAAENKAKESRAKLLELFADVSKLLELTEQQMGIEEAKAIALYLPSLAASKPLQKYFEK